MNAGPTFTIEVKGRLAGQSTFTFIDTVVGSSPKTIAVSNYDFLQIRKFKMAQETNAGFTLPAQADAVASNTVNNLTNVAEQVVMEALPVANTSTRDILIGGAVLIVLLIIFFILKPSRSN